jgi:AraC family transcriptional regulator, regulatory protein of adaptative response / methylated-DNA-[protein]-cysteine methyltransferase
MTKISKPAIRGKSPFFVTDKARWQALVDKDKRADGLFWFSVKTTGVYCRPSCPARLPNRENVAFHLSPRDAEKAGFRACKRCDPKGPGLAGQHAEAVALACRMIKEVDEFPSLNQLVEAVKMSPGYLRRLFKSATGLTPKDYANALARDLQDRFPKAHLIGGDEKYEKLVAKVIGFIEAPKIGLDLPLDIRGTAFQQRVWKELQRIPAGKTASYSEVAKRIGFPKSTRAVAQACGANALAVAVPCHRVLRNNGDISGYRWGVDRKQALLARERMTT